MDRLEQYPAVEARLRDHLKDKEAQMRRIETILETMGESPSTLKDSVSVMFGNL